MSVSPGLVHPIKIWNAGTGTEIEGSFQGSPPYLTTVAYSPDGKQIVSGAGDTTLQLWDGDVESGNKLISVLEGHTDWVCCVAFSPDGSMITSGAYDRIIRLWDAHTHQALGRPLWGHGHKITALAFTSNGKFLVSSSYDKTIRVWDLQVVLKPSSIHSSLVSGVSPFNDGFSIEDGWVLGPNKELLFWLPPWNRDISFPPMNPIVISQTPTIIDYSRFVHGKDWKMCKTFT